MVQITWEESLGNAAYYVRATMMEMKSLETHIHIAGVAGWITSNDRDSERR